MNPHADDPRNVDEVISRKEELVAAAKAARLDYVTALANAPADNVAHIGVLAKVLGIDVFAALDPAVPVSQLRNAARSQE
jgi:hypothetical protein